MENQEIKKILYKEKPVATRQSTIVSHSGTTSYYKAHTSIGEITFTIPHSEMGLNTFNQEENAQLLIRWID